LYYLSIFVANKIRTDIITIVREKGKKANGGLLRRVLWEQPNVSQENINLQGVTSQNTEIFIVTALRTSAPYAYMLANF
jgi:hypothetical protein